MPNSTADYIARWVAGAKNVHSLDIDYVGVSVLITSVFTVQFCLNVIVRILSYGNILQDWVNMLGLPIRASLHHLSSHV